MSIGNKIKVLETYYLPYLTRYLRMLPSFIVVEVQKGGTTSLNGYLNTHPDVVMARGKETWFFDKKYHKGLDWYQLHFPL
jgi:hypothetical protein